MNVLELFAGSRSIGKVAKMKGCNVFSVDINNFDGIDLVQDIEYLKKDMIPFVPDVIWASPMCTTYSIAGIWHHRNNGKPKTDFAKKSDNVILNVLRLFKEFNCTYFIENPRGYLRKMYFMKNIPRTTVTYCSYGGKNMKPTDIWSNDLYDIFNPNGWIGKPMCFNGNKKCHHESAPRGSSKGIQGLNSNYERSKIPDSLCASIIDHCLMNFKLKQTQNAVNITQ